MITRLAVVSILVRDQEEALRFYTDILGFEKRSDETFGPGLRWLTVAPSGQKEVEIALLKPEPALQGEEVARKLSERVGQSTTWSFTTDDCRATYEELEARGVQFISPPKEAYYGVEAIFVDLYGNTFSMVELKENRQTQEGE
jgi:predicted enzyme related to lactoylglutathione lyase